MSREVPFEDDAMCDICGSEGASDFMGDFMCDSCAEEAFGKPEACNRCGHMTCVCGL